MISRLEDFIIPNARDPRTDVDGTVAVRFSSPDEFQAFLGVLNRANIVMRDAEDAVPFLVKFMPHFIGGGIATIEMSQHTLDDKMEPIDFAPDAALDG